MLVPVRCPNYGAMPHDETPFKYKSSIWDRSFLLTIVALAATGILYSIGHLLAEEETQGAYSAGDGDGDGGDE